MAIKGSAAKKIRFSHVPQDAGGYDLICLRPVVHVDQEGTISPSSVAVFPYSWEGRKRAPLPVNSDSGAKHYVFRVIGSSRPTPATSVTSSMIAMTEGARFDLVAKSDVTVQTVSGTTVYWYLESAILATEYISVERDGIDGKASAFTSIVFKRSKTQPATPSGGTYANPIPTTAGWSDAPEQGADPLWLSRARFTPDTTSPQWSTPAPVEDSTGIEYVFSASESDPGAPADTHPYPSSGGGNWTKNAENAVWMAVAIKNQGMWEPWSYTRIKGEGGDNVVLVRATPETVHLKKGTLLYKSYVDVYDGSDLVNASEVTYPTLTADSGQWLVQNVVKWDFAFEGNRFCYIFRYFGQTTEVNSDISVNVTYKGKQYPVVIQLRSVDGQKGDKGDTGDKGDKGDKGDAGDDAVMYRLSLTPSQLTYDLNSKTYDSSAVSVSVSKIVGNSETKVSNLSAEGLAVTFDSYVGGVYQSTKSCTDTVTFGPTAGLYSRLDFVLKKGNTVVASRTLGVTVTGRNGTNGKNGVWVPPVMLWKDYPTDYEFQAGKPGNGDVRLDMVGVLNASNQVVPYFCKLTHVKGSNLSPEKDPDRWQVADAGVYKFLATELLWAAVGQIDFFNSQAIRIGDNDGMCGYFGVPISGNGAILFLGGDNVSDASFVVYKDGRIVASNADISGRISTSVMDYKVSTAAEGSVPNGSLCFDIGSIKLPHLNPGTVRSIKVFNPKRTRTYDDLLLIPENSNVRIASALDWMEAKSGNVSIENMGKNGACHLELLGINIQGVTTWSVARLA